MSTGDRHQPADHFTQIPNQFLEDQRLSTEARLLGVILARFAFGKGLTWPSQDRLAKILGKTPKSVSRYAAELAKCDLISVKRQSNARGNVYELKFMSPGFYQTPVSGSPQPDTHFRFNQTPKSSSSGQPCPRNNIREEQLLTTTTEAAADDRVDNGQESQPAVPLPLPEQFEAQARRSILAERLHNIGVSRDKANALIENYPEERIRRQILYMADRTGIKFPGAFMVKAVAKDLAAPSDEFEYTQTIKREVQVWQRAAVSRQMALYVEAMRPHVERYDKEHPGKIDAARERWVSDKVEAARKQSLKFRWERHENEWQFGLALTVARKLSGNVAENERST